MDIEKKRLRILNIPVDALDMEEAIAIVRSYLTSSEGGARVIFAVNPEKSFSLRKNPELHRAFAEADLLIPDGIGVVAAARLLYGARISRVTGADLHNAICSLAAREGRSMFIYGAREEVNRRAVETLAARYPGIKIAGRAHGFVGREEMPTLIKSINASRAEILFVALGSPKQEIWITEHRKDLKHVRVCQGIGGTLDTVAGTVKRAPDLWQRFSAEWLYRLITDPRRIKRQKNLPVFAAQVFFLRLRTLLGELK